MLSLWALYSYIIDFVKIRKLLAAYRVKLLGQKTTWETVSLLGKDLRVTAGTINKKTDKDDAWWYVLCRRYDTIFDIGANVGYASILACMEQPGKQLLLADPNPQALDAARENLEKNGLGQNKTYINAFVGDKVGEEVKFYTLGTGSAGSMFASHADSARAVNSHYMVPTTTLDVIVGETGLWPDLVKIDVEAAESYVLNGASQIAVSRPMVFMVEMHGPEEMPMERNAGLVLDWCYKTGYTAWYLKEHIKLETAQQIAHRGRCHLLLLPEEMEYPEYLKEIQEGAALQ